MAFQCTVTHRQILISQFLSCSSSFVCRHDIVRDFTLASQVDLGLEHLQRSFIRILVSGASSKFPGKAAAAAVTAYQSSSLFHHLRGILAAPFANDELASVLFFHQSASVVSQALASVTRSDVRVQCALRECARVGRTAHSRGHGNAQSALQTGAQIPSAG